jgi:hypothetical protein
VDEKRGGISLVEALVGRFHELLPDHVAELSSLDPVRAIFDAAVKQAVALLPPSSVNDGAAKSALLRRTYAALAALMHEGPGANAPAVEKTVRGFLGVHSGDEVVLERALPVLRYLALVNSLENKLDMVFNAYIISTDPARRTDAVTTTSAESGETGHMYMGGRV